MSGALITLCVDFGGSRIKLGLVRNGIVLAREAMEARSHDGLASQLPRIVSAFEEMRVRSGAERAEFGAVSVGFPSVLDPATGRILTAFGKYLDAPRIDLPNWSRAALGLELTIEHDVRAALVGEWREGAGKGFNNIVMVTLGTGLGSAVLMDGRLLRGRHGQGGILGGHFTVRLGGRLCTCGNRGCAEAEASTSVLSEIIRARPEFTRGRLRQLEPPDYEGVFRLAREGDAGAAAVRERSIEVWAAMIVNLVHAYDPECVIVGGGILAGAADFLPDIERSVRALAHTPWGVVKILPACLGDDAALIGCDFLAREKFPAS